MLISKCDHNKRQCFVTSKFRRVNPNSWHRARPHEPNLTYLYTKEMRVSLYMNLRSSCKPRKKYKRYNFTNFDVTRIINCVKYEMSSYQKFTTKNLQNAEYQLREFTCNKGPF